VFTQDLINIDLNIYLNSPLPLTSCLFKF